MSVGEARRRAHTEEFGDLHESYAWDVIARLSHWLDLEGQSVDLAWGVWPLDVALIGHQLDLRLPENAHVASLDGAAVVREDVVGRFEQLELDDDWTANSALLLIV